MNRRWFKPFAFAALALSIASASCDSLPTDLPVSADTQVTAQQPGMAQAIVSPAAVHATTYHFVTANPENGSILDLTKILGLLGGVLQVNKHTLTVPQGAVLLPTLFSMSVERNGHIEVELHAFLQSVLGLLDIGGKGFLKPVTLSLSYANATNVTDASRLKIALLNADGSIKEILPTVVDTKKKTVTAQLPHFSTYAVVSD